MYVVDEANYSTVSEILHNDKYSSLHKHTTSDKRMAHNCRCYYILQIDHKVCTNYAIHTTCVA